MAAQTFSNSTTRAPQGYALISDLDHQGRGVGRADHKVVFIDGALPGESVRFRYTKRGRHYDQGTLESVVEASPERAEPPCPYFGRCGGCALQHLKPEAQVTAKAAQLRNQLQQEAGTEPDYWLPPLEGPPLHYRSKARLSIRAVHNKGVLVGFRERASRYVTEMEQCPVLAPQIEALLLPLRTLVAGMSRPDRIPQAEVCTSEGDTCVVLRHLTPLTDSDRHRLSAFQARHGVVVETQARGPESATPIDPERPAYLYYTLPPYGITLSFRGTDFIQVNLGVNAQLVQQAVTLLDPQPGEQILDLYCGIGNFSLPLAYRGAEVHGIDGDPELITRAQANAYHNGTLAERVRFKQNDLSRLSLENILQGRTADKLLLDPPRSGAIEVVKQLQQWRPRKVVYISCNPGTLARDAGVLTKVCGYTLQAAGIADMFPHTAHVESMACFVA